MNSKAWVLKEQKFAVLKEQKFAVLKEQNFAVLKEHECLLGDSTQVPSNQDLEIVNLLTYRGRHCM